MTVRVTVVVKVQEVGPLHHPLGTGISVPYSNWVWFRQNAPHLLPRLNGTQTLRLCEHTAAFLQSGFSTQTHPWEFMSFALGHWSVPYK